MILSAAREIIGHPAAPPAPSPVTPAASSQSAGPAGPFLPSRPFATSILTGPPSAGARVARNPLSLGLAGVKVLGSTEEFQGEKVPCGAIMALRGQKFPSDEAAPASDEVESSAILASDPPAAGATPAIVDAGAPENRARPVGAKAPNQIVPKGREGGIDAFAVPVICPQPRHPRLSTNQRCRFSLYYAFPV